MKKPEVEACGIQRAAQLKTKTSTEDMDSTIKQICLAKWFFLSLKPVNLLPCSWKEPTIARACWIFPLKGELHNSCGNVN